MAMGIVGHVEEPITQDLRDEVPFIYSKIKKVIIIEE